MLDTLRRPELLSWTALSPARLSKVIDPNALGYNLAQCLACQGRWFSLACAAEAVHRFLAPRIITTLVVTVALCAAIVALV